MVKLAEEANLCTGKLYFGAENRNRTVHLHLIMIAL
jgi:hypothetical protein